MSNKEKCIIYSSYEYDPGKKIIKVLTEKNQFKTVFFSKKYLSETEPFVYGELFYNNKINQNPKSFLIEKEFGNISDSFDKFTLISIFFELANRLNIEDNTLFYVLYSNLELINKHDINNKQYLIYLFSYLALKTGYLHITDTCPVCNKNITILNDFFMTYSKDFHCFVCKNHNTSGIKDVEKKMVLYLKLLKAKSKGNVILPKVQNEENIIKFYKKFYEIVFDYNMPSIFKFIKYIV